MFGLTEIQLREIENVSRENESVRQMYEIMQIFHSDPSIRMYGALAKTTGLICDELESMQRANIIGSSPKEDKIFERINTLVSKFADYKNAFKIGKDAISALKLEGDDMVSSGNWTDEMAKKHRQKQDA